MIEIRARKLNPHATLPKTWSDQACGLDLHVCSIGDNGRPSTIYLPPRMTRAVPTGIAIECPRGYYAAICSRAGMAKQNSVFVTNAPGIIDPDYRGELMVLLYNGGLQNQWVKHGDRVGQLLILPFIPATVREVTELTETDRGGARFGSTGQ